jgi:DNA topoisomerase-1
VESPAKARTIEKFLGRRYKVKASLGHLIDLPKSQLGVDPESDFAPKYITIRGKTKILKELRDAAKEASGVLLATDPDREGEAIAWHLSNALQLPCADCRIEFHEITKDAIARALQRPRNIDMDKVNAQQARRILDRLVGYKLSPLLWRKVRKGLSAGRVQSVAVRLIVDREAEIRAFRTEEFWSLTAWVYRPEDGPDCSFAGKLHSVAGDKIALRSSADADKIVARLEGSAYAVAAVERRTRRRQPPAPFTTSSLQQEAARRLGFAARRTMQVAQQLYEGLDLGPLGRTGLITYIRSDSTRVAAEAVAQAREYVRGRYGQPFVGRGRGPAKAAGPVVQGAHEAIRPTQVLRTPDDVRSHLNSDQFRLYGLIWERFVASQMTAAVFDVVSADIAAADCLFRATGQTMRFAGFTAVYRYAREEQDHEKDEDATLILPELAKGERLDLRELIPKQHFTQPPPRYSEATLVKTMEELGIGRPSTYAPIIETVQVRGYVHQEERRFHPTPLGEAVTKLLADHFPDVVSVGFTASMEESLDQVERGEEDWLKLLHRFYGPFVDTLGQAERNLERVKIPAEETEIPCEKCGRMMVIKHGRYGPFLACPGFPECRNTRPLQRKVEAGRCPLCGKALVERKTKRGRKFYGCEGYPECTFTSWNKPLQQKCPKCGAFLVQKRSKERGIYYQCGRRECDFQTQSLRGLKDAAAATAATSAGATEGEPV